jgi:hypothetical protein
MSKLDKEVLRACKQFDKASENFQDTVGSIFDLCLQGEGAKDLARQELHDAANQFIKKIKQVEKVVNKMLDEE